MRESMNPDGEVGEMRSTMILRVSVSMGRRLSLEVTMMDIGDTDILIGVGVARGAEADQGSTDEGDHVGELLERRSSYSIRLSYEQHDRMKSILRHDMKLCICPDPPFFTLVALSIPKCVSHFLVKDI